MTSVFTDLINKPQNTQIVVTQPIKTEEKPVEKAKKRAGEMIKKTAPIVVPLATIPVSVFIAYKISNKNSNKTIETLKQQITELSAKVASNSSPSTEQFEALAKELREAIAKNTRSNAKMWPILLSLAGMGTAYKVGQCDEPDDKTIAKAVNNITNKLTSISRTEKAADNAAKVAASACRKADEAMNNTGCNTLKNKYTRDFGSVPLLTNNNSLTVNAKKYAAAIDNIQNASKKYLFNAPQVTPINKPHPAIWSVTSEFAPIKEGGLGSVPVEVQNNVTRLGVQIPTFIPMYQQKGVAVFKEQDGKYTYTYKGKQFDLEKAASYQIDAYKEGKTVSENVEIFVNNSKDKFGNDKQLIFIKNDTYFNGTIYESNNRTEEPEKFAFFSKAVYEFAKAKEDANSVKNLVVSNSDAFNSVPNADALMLNDWQASPIAALARYKAPMENAYSQLSDTAADKLSKMNIITIGHNAMYQGSTNNNNTYTQKVAATSNILNTLFDNFAYDIVSNAKSGAVESNPYDDGLKNLDNVLVMNTNNPAETHTNLLNMGICLSNYFHPVSQNYAKEIISPEHPELANELRWALTQKNGAGSLYGIINGNDFNNLSINAKQGQIKNNVGFEYETYEKTDSIDKIMTARNNNKINFYNKYVLPFSKKNNENDHSPEVDNIRNVSAKLEFVDPANKTVVPNLTNEELLNTPVISSVGRLVSQKGVDVMCDAIKMLFDNWDKDFPNKNKPIFFIGGADGEGGVQRKVIENLKQTQLKQEDNNRVIFGHGWAPAPAIQAASDFFLLPSKFEPCGLTQGESFALATPVIGSAVGGIVDTVNRDGKTNGILTKQNEQLTATSFYNAMKEGLKIYFDNPEQYKKMVTDSLAEDFSWIQKGKQGPVYEYLEKIGISKDNLPDA